MHAPVAATLEERDMYGTLHEKHVRLSAGKLRHMYADVAARFSRAALEGLSEEQRMGVPESSLNPIVWAVGHCAHFYEAMVYRVLFPDAPPLHGPGTLLAGWDVEGAFDSFRAAHPDRWEGVGLAEVSPSGSYPPSDELVRGYRDRVTGLLEAALPAGDDALLSAAETYLRATHIQISRPHHRGVSRCPPRHAPDCCDP